jgi:hypothetical protein
LTESLVDTGRTGSLFNLTGLGRGTSKFNFLLLLLVYYDFLSCYSMYSIFPPFLSISFVSFDKLTFVWIKRLNALHFACYAFLFLSAISQERFYGFDLLSSLSLLKSKIASIHVSFTTLCQHLKFEILKEFPKNFPKNSPKILKNFFKKFPPKLKTNPNKSHKKSDLCLYLGRNPFRACFLYVFTRCEPE